MRGYFTAIIFAIVVSLTGCATTESGSRQGQETCPFVQRNLTIKWQQRTYWCVPSQQPQQP